MVNWQITATTVYCDAVNEEVTILVYKDGSVKCTGYEKLAKSNQKADGQLRCVGTQCRRAVEYKEKLLAEEAKKKAPQAG